MIEDEVNTMENNDEILTPQQEQPAEPKSEYKPRPLWQIIGAWALLIIFVGIMIATYIRMLGGAG